MVESGRDLETYWLGAGVGLGMAMRAPTEMDRLMSTNFPRTRQGAKRPVRNQQPCVSAYFHRRAVSTQSASWLQVRVERVRLLPHQSFYLPPTAGAVTHVSRQAAAIGGQRRRDHRRVGLLRDVGGGHPALGRTRRRRASRRRLRCGRDFPGQCLGVGLRRQKKDAGAAGSAFAARGWQERLRRRGVGMRRGIGCEQPVARRTRWCRTSRRRRRLGGGCPRPAARGGELQPTGGHGGGRDHVGI